jgi:pyrroloquinoline-quinone synthase
MESLQFIQQLEEEVRAHPAVRHPFLKRFATEPLTVEQIQTFGLQHYQLVKVFVTYMTNLLPRFPDGAGNRFFGPIFNDEFGQWTIFRSHAALYRNFLKALGLEEEAWGRVHLLPETAWFIQAHLELTRSEEFLIGLGAIGPGHEFSIPIMFNDLVEGFRRNTQLSEKELEYFLMHIEEDVEHAKLFNEAIAQYAPDEKGQEKVRQGTLISLSARKVFWDGLDRVIFEPTPPPSSSAS